MKVTITDCISYDKRPVKKAVEKTVDNIGGIEAFVPKNSRVFIKVNLLSAKAPSSAVTTHPAILEAVIRLVKKQTDKISVGDTRAFHDVKTVAKAAGILQVCEKNNVGLVEPGKPTKLGHLIVSGEAKDFDVIINLPKLKTHMLTILTGACKNLFGFVIGRDKQKAHVTHSNPYQFSKMIYDLYEYYKPALNIMDGVVGQSGYGPMSGNKTGYGLIMASDDAMAMDKVCADMLQLKVPLIDIAKSKMDLDSINVMGKMKKFDIESPQSMGRIARGALMFKSMIAAPHPKILKDKCNKCETCVKACPVEVISVADDGYPRIAIRDCIRCYCCHESCPEHAIGLYRKGLARLFGQTKDL